MNIRRYRAPALITLAFLAYAAAFIRHASMVIGGERYFVLMDDAMISMTYARNLAAGHGLVWYPGAAPVEGFTNPLWVLFMAAVHRLPLDPANIGLPVQLAGTLILAVTAWAVFLLARRLAPDRPAIPLAAMLLAAFSYPLVYWTLMGMEVGLLALVVATAALLALRSLDADRVPYGFYLLAGAATLIRLDAAVPYLAGWTAFLLLQKRRRTANLLAGAGILLAFAGGQTLFRLAYFGDLLPNTYYLKMTGYPALLRVAHGMLAFAGFAGKANPILIALPFAALVFRHDRARLLLAWLVAVQWLYSVWVGGDSWEEWGGANRFVSTVLPLYSVLLADALVRAASAVGRHVAESAGGARRGLLPARGMVPVAVILAIVGMNAPTAGEALLLAPPFQADLAREMIVRAGLIETYTGPDASVAVTCAGILPYFADRRPIDLLGKCDPVIAHEASRVPADFAHIGEFIPGHTKYDYAYSVGEMKPDVIVQVWGGGRDDMAAYLRSAYIPYRIAAADAPEGYPFWFRRGSPNVRWDALDAPGSPARALLMENAPSATN